MKVSLAFVTIVLCLIGVSIANPGLKLVATPKIFNDFASNFLPQLLSQLGPIKVPDTTIAGFNLKDITLQKMSLSGPDTSVAFFDDHGTFKTNSFALNMSFYIEGKVFGIIPVHFTAGGSSSNSELGFDIGFDYKDSFVQININNLHLKIRNLVMVFPKDILGSIVEALTNLLRDPIQETVSYLVSNTLKGTFQNIINNLLTQIPKVGPIPGTPLSVNFQATQKPLINPTYLCGHINGTFFNTDKGYIVPDIDLPVTVPDFDATSSKTVQAFITEYTLNTIMDGVHKTDKLAINLTQSMIPAEAGLKLTVAWLKQFVPSVTQFYPNEKSPLILGLRVSKAPVIKLLPADIGVTVGIVMTFYVIKDDNSTAEVLSVASSFNLHANVTIENWVLKPYIINGIFDSFSVVSSQVGTFDPAKFQQGFNILLMFALPGFNAAKPNFPLPTVPGVNLESLFVNPQAGHIQVQASPVFTTIDIKKLIQRDFTLADYAMPFDEFLSIEENDFLAL